MLNPEPDPDEMNANPQPWIEVCEKFRKAYKKLRANQLRREPWKLGAGINQMRARCNPERMFPERLTWAMGDDFTIKQVRK